MLDVKITKAVSTNSEDWYPRQKVTGLKGRRYVYEQSKILMQSHGMEQIID